MKKDIHFKLASVFIATFFGLMAIEGGLRIGGFNYRNVVGDYEDGVGWKYLPNQKVTTKAFYGIPTTVTINSLGLRGKEIEPKIEGRQRILLLGDSYTLGYGVSDNETVPFYLEGLLAKNGYDAEIINGGIGGTTIFQQRGLYDKYEKKIEPDEIILLFCLNDLKDIQNFTKESRMQRRHSDGVRSLKRFFYNTAIGDLIMKARLAWMSRQAFKIASSPAFAAPADGDPFETYLNSLSKLAQSVASHKRSLTLVILPLGPHPDDYEIAGWSVETFTKEISARIGREKVDVFSLYEKFPEKEREGFSFPDWHYKPEGNRLIAEILKGYILKRR